MQEHSWVWSTLQGPPSHSCKVGKTSAATGGPASWAQVGRPEWPELVFFPFETVLLFSWYTSLCGGVHDHLGSRSRSMDHFTVRRQTLYFPSFTADYVVLKNLSCWTWATLWKKWYLYDRKHWGKKAWICHLEQSKSIWDEVGLRYCPWLQICLCLLN